MRLLIIDEVHLLNDERGPVRRARRCQSDRWLGMAVPMRSRHPSLPCLSIRVFLFQVIESLVARTLRQVGPYYCVLGRHLLAWQQVTRLTRSRQRMLQLVLAG